MPTFKKYEETFESKVTITKAVVRDQLIGRDFSGSMHFLAHCLIPDLG
jgi:hypothetical protein